MATKYPGTEAETRALNALICLTRAAESVVRRTSAHVEAAELTLSQFGVLEALLHLGPLNQRALAQKLLRTGGNMTMVVDNLEKRGLVTRAPDASDRRAYLVKLTAEGRRLIKRLFAHHAQGVADDFSGAFCRGAGGVASAVSEAGEARATG